MSSSEEHNTAEEAEKVPAVSEPETERLPVPEQAEESAAVSLREPTQKQRKLQILLGWLAGFLIWFCMALGVMYPENELLSWSFLLVFAAAMFGRNAVERRTGMDLRLYMRSFLISLIVFLAVFVILGPVTHILKVVE